MKKTLIYLLICCLLQPSFAVAENPSSKNPSTGNSSLLDPLGGVAQKVEDFKKGDLGVHKELARPISKELFKRMGTSGFLLSKYLNYRKQLNQPRCTYSEQVSFASYILVLIGDIANHVIVLKNKKNLKKKFKSDRDKISEYARGKKITSFEPDDIPDESKNLHIRAIDFQIEENELELKRLRMLQRFKYPGLALQLTANILGAFEIFAENSDIKIATKARACRKKKEPEAATNQAKSEAQVDAQRAIADEQSSESPDQDEEVTPWYLVPFQFLSGLLDGAKDRIDQAGDYLKKKGRQIKDSRLVKGVKENQFIKKLRDGRKRLRKGSYDNDQEQQAASYSEEMLVGIIHSIKKDKDRKGLGGKIVDEAETIAIRLAVRKLIKVNIKAVKKFMFSAVGRVVVYAYNIFVIKKEFDSLQAQVKYAKAKINLLKSTKRKFLKATSFTPYFNMEKKKTNLIKYTYIYKSVVKIFAQEIQAASIKDSDNKLLNDLFICIGSTNCKNPVTKLTPFQKSYISSFPEEIKKEYMTTIKQSYVLKSLHNNQTKKLTFNSIDIDKVKKEVLQKEKLWNKHARLLNDKGLVPYSAYEKYETRSVENVVSFLNSQLDGKFDPQNTTNLGLVQDFNLDQDDFSSEPESTKTSPRESKSKNDNTLAQLSSSSNKKINNIMNKKYKYKQNDLLDQSADIWQILHMRYLKEYKSLGIGQ